MAVKAGGDGYFASLENERLYTELKRYKSILRTRPNAMTALYDENEKLRKMVLRAHGCKIKGM